MKRIAFILALALTSVSLSGCGFIDEFKKSYKEALKESIREEIDYCIDFCSLHNFGIINVLKNILP